jgi:hypothetical protein
MTGRLRITWALKFAGPLVDASPSSDIETNVFIALSCTTGALKPEENVIGKRADPRALSKQGIDPLL